MKIKIEKVEMDCSIVCWCGKPIPKGTEFCSEDCRLEFSALLAVMEEQDRI